MKRVQFLLIFVIFFLSSSTVFAVSAGGIFGEQVKRTYGAYNSSGSSIGHRVQTFKLVENEDSLYVIEDELLIDTKILGMKTYIKTINRMIYDDVSQKLIEFETESTSTIPFSGTSVIDITGILEDDIWHIIQIKDNNPPNEVDINTNDFDWLDIITPMIPWAVSYPNPDENETYTIFSLSSLEFNEVEITGGNFEEISFNDNTYQIQNLTMKDSDGTETVKMSVFEDSTDYILEPSIALINPVIQLESVEIIE